MGLDEISQVCLVFTGVIAVWLAGSKSEKGRFWAGMFGMAGEPFWFITGYLNNQWGILVLVFLYAFSWGRVIWNNRYWR